MKNKILHFELFIGWILVWRSLLLWLCKDQKILTKHILFCVLGNSRFCTKNKKKGVWCRSLCWLYLCFSVLLELKYQQYACKDNFLILGKVFQQEQGYFKWESKNNEALFYIKFGPSFCSWFTCWKMFLNYWVVLTHFKILYDLHTLIWNIKEFMHRCQWRARGCLQLWSST